MKIGAFGALDYDRDNPPPYVKKVCVECPFRYTSRDTVDGGRVLLNKQGLYKNMADNSRGACHMTQDTNHDQGPKVKLCLGQEAFRANAGLPTFADKNPAVFHSLEEIAVSAKAL